MILEIANLVCAVRRTLKVYVENYKRDKKSIKRLKWLGKKFL